MEVKSQTSSHPISQKQLIIMSTNLTPKTFRRKFEIYPNIPLHKYIELYEQVFNIDLYAYRVSFKYEEEIINKL
jgi:hypothetical protein